MDGTKCTHIGCSCHDFLPFHCPLCNNVFCLQHRSRFSHNPCAVANLALPPAAFSSEVTAAAAKAAQNMIDSVQARFDNTTDPVANVHVNHMKTSVVPESQVLSGKAISTMDRLKDISNNSSSLSERKISCKTRNILIKSNSIGNASIPALDRIYFSVNFLCGSSSSGESGAPNSSSSSSSSSTKLVNFFYKRTMTLGEMLHQLGLTFPQLSYGAAVAPSGMSLVLYTEDTPDWRQWDRSKPLEILLESFEEVIIDFTSTVEVVNAQKVLEQQRIISHEDAIVNAEEALRAAKLAANVGNDDELITYPLCVGEIIEYYPSSGSSSSRTDKANADSMELVTVVGVHQDDFPNFYYTIRFNTSKREKQTDRFHLRRRPGALSARLGITGAAVCEVEGGIIGAPITLKIVHGGRNFDIMLGLIGDRNSIDGLKGIISQYTGIPPKAQKLVYKGVVLKDGDIDLKSAKIANGSKMTLIGSVGK